MTETVNMLCYKSKTLSNGEHPLMIRVCKDGKKKYVSLGVSVKAEHWNFEKNLPKTNYPNKEYINTLIANKRKEYETELCYPTFLGRRKFAYLLLPVEHRCSGSGTLYGFWRR